MSSLSNEEYLSGLLTGNQDVILGIYEKIFPKVRYFILKNKGSQKESEEIFQEALYQLTVRLQSTTIEINSSFEGYFFTICKNLWRKELLSGKKWVRNEEVIAQYSEESSLFEVYEKEQRWELFEQKMNDLSENCRQLLNEYFKKVSYDEIVRKFNYSSENVAFQRMFKCKKKLKDLIRKDLRFKNLSE